jgi:hypothetical protein
MDQRVPPGDGRVVEADVGGEAAPEPRPSLLKRDYADALAVVVGEVVAAGDERLARAEEPVGTLHLLGAPAAGVTGREHRRAGELLAGAARARRHDVALMQGYCVATALAVE